MEHGGFLDRLSFELNNLESSTRTILNCLETGEPVRESTSEIEEYIRGLENLREQLEDFKLSNHHNVDNEDAVYQINECMLDTWSFVTEILAAVSEGRLSAPGLLESAAVEHSRRHNFNDSLTDFTFVPSVSATKFLFREYRLGGRTQSITWIKFEYAMEIAHSPSAEYSRREFCLSVAGMFLAGPIGPLFECALGRNRRARCPMSRLPTEIIAEIARTLIGLKNE